MDDRDVAELRTRLLGLQNGLIDLDTLANLYQNPRLGIADLTITLTAPQRAAVKASTTILATQLETLASSLTTPTGATGQPDPQAIAGFQARPLEAHDFLEQSMRVVNRLANLPPVIQPDGSYRVLIAADLVQQASNQMATLREAVRAFVAMQRLRLTTG